MASTFRKLIHPIYRDVPPLHLIASPTSTCFPRRRAPSTSAPLTTASAQHTLCIASLPDEIILLIFRFLGAEATTCTLASPRHAFNFAITNTRFFILFRTLLTRVTPNLENELPKTLSKTHLLSVVRLAGPNLIQLALPRFARHVLYHLPSLCPNLRKLSFVDYHNYDTLPVKRALTLPLKTLQIIDPSASTLALITQPLDELYLTCCVPFLSKQLAIILENPPSKFYLQLCELVPLLSHPYFQTHLGNIFDSLEKAKHRIEDLTFRIQRRKYSIEERDNQAFLADAQSIVTDTVRPHISSCRRVVLEGEAMRLIRLARPDAEVLLQDYAQSFTCVNGTLYPVKLPLWDAYMTQDLSYVHTVMVGSKFNLRWRKLLANIKLRLAVVEDPFLAGQLQLYATTLEVQTCDLRTVDWLKYRGVEEVRLVGPFKIREYFALRQFFDNLAYLLDQFKGNVVWLLPISLILLKDDLAMHAARKTLDAVDRFERSGGDAGTVRAFITQIKWLSRPLARIEKARQDLLSRWQRPDSYLLL